MPQVPTPLIDKNVRFQAAYTSLTFNKKNLAFYRMDGVLQGMDVTSFSPTTILVSLGAFIQRGIIVELLNNFLFNKPGYGFPWAVYATTDDEYLPSPTTIDVAPLASVPAGVVVLGTTEDGETWVLPAKISIKEIMNRLLSLENERKVRTNLLCNGGFELIQTAKGMDFQMPGPAMDGWQADNLSDKAPGSRLDIITDPVQTLRGGAAVKLTSENYLDPGGPQPVGPPLLPRVLGNARLHQFVTNYKELIGEPLTLGVSLRLPPGHVMQLHDLEISIYGSSIGTPGYSDTPVDKFDLVIPTGTLSQNWQKFWLHGTINSVNTGLVIPATPAFPGISVRIAYINSEPAAFPTGVIDRVMVDDVMLYMGTVENPAYFPLPPALDWLMAERLFEAEQYDLNQLGQATDIEYKLGEERPYRTKKLTPPSVSHDLIDVGEDGAPLAVNAEAGYGKLIVSTGRDEYSLKVSKADAGFRPARLKALVRSQS
jgi:hypothetical protein